MKASPSFCCFLKVYMCFAVYQVISVIRVTDSWPRVAKMPMVTVWQNANDGHLLHLKSRPCNNIHSLWLFLLTFSQLKNCFRNKGEPNILGSLNFPTCPGGQNIKEMKTQWKWFLNVDIWGTSIKYLGQWSKMTRVFQWNKAIRIPVLLN